MGIALAANIGGQASPISSPQNLIALAAMDPQLDWARWFAVSIPVSGLSIVLIWLLLLVSYRPARVPGAEPNVELEIKPVKASRETFTLQQWWVSFVCVGTIALWCVEHQLEYWIGDMGVVALIPVIAFFATGVLKKVCALKLCLFYAIKAYPVRRRMISNSSPGLSCSLRWAASHLAKVSRRADYLKTWTCLFALSLRDCLSILSCLFCHSSCWYVFPLFLFPVGNIDVHDVARSSPRSLAIPLQACYLCL
jgi:hypothetical protein